MSIEKRKKAAEKLKLYRPNAEKYSGLSLSLLLFSIVKIGLQQFS
jgi:hypothetical protein